MKIKIESDVFDVSKRIKEIDENYFIMFNLNNNKYELHCASQPNTYCFSYPYDDLDERFIDMIYKTNITNIDNIIEQIDNNNAKIENNVNSSVKDKSNFMLREIYNFSNISSKNFDESKAFSSVWR